MVFEESAGKEDWKGDGIGYLLSRSGYDEMRDADMR